MHVLRLAILACSIVALSSAAQAETDYTNVTLAPGVTMDLPAAVATDFNPPGGTADDLMFIALQRAERVMTCFLIRTP